MFRLRVIILLCCLFAGGHCFGQSTGCTPSNIGFEDGTFNNWQCYTGSIDAAGTITLTLNTAVYNRHTIISDKTTLDPYGQFPQLCPFGGKYSVRLGNDQTGAQAESLSYTFNVPAGSNAYNLTFYYAVVLQNPNHQPYQQPKFTVTAFDVTDGKPIDCSSFNFVASAYLPGFKLASDSVFYKPWAPAVLHLQGYEGKQITLQFTTNDCTLGKHFGYAYIDVDEDCLTLVKGNVYCTSQTSVTISAPTSFFAYQWYNSDFTQQLGTQQTLTISPPPPDNTEYAVVLVPFDGLGCQDTLYTAIHSVIADFVFKTVDTLQACQATGANLTDPAVTAGSSSNLTYTYYTDPAGTNLLAGPTAIFAQGTYYIRGMNPDSCTGVRPVYVKLYPPPALTITTPKTVVYPATVDISATFTHVAGVTYSYYTDKAVTKTLTDYQDIGKSGTYYIEAISPLGCTNIQPVTVTIDPPPAPVIQAVTAFTPNGDGINDLFTVSITGLAAFESLKIFNRYGQLVFQTKSNSVPWDGTINGKPVTAGTYYWLFNGRNTYYNSPITQGGYIAVLR